MIIIEPTKSLTQPYKVRYTGKNNETLATSELLKNKKACWRNINAMAKNILDENDYSGWDDELTYEQKGVICKRENGYFEDYCGDGYLFTSVTLSFASLLRSHGITDRYCLLAYQ